MIFNTIGERICYCRNLLGLTQNEFAILYNISKPTIARWELNIVEIPHRRIKTLLNLYSQNGLLVSEEWILLGIGIEPYLLNNDNQPILNFDEMNHKIFNSLKLDDDRLQLYQITSIFMSPIVQYADYIIGKTLENIKPLHNELCFVVRQNEIIVGIYNNATHQINNCYNECITLNEFDSLGKVKWIIKR